MVEPPPAQKPHPQIWMGAGGERSIRHARGRESLRRFAREIMPTFAD